MTEQIASPGFLDASLFANLAVAHLWQSVALAAVLATVLILGRKLNGATRYSLAGAAFAAALILPMASFIPGESLVRSALKALDAPVSVTPASEMPAPAPTPVAASDTREPAKGIAAAVTRIALDGVRDAISDGFSGKTPEAKPVPPAPAAVLAPVATRATPVATEPAKPLFTLPQITLPELPRIDLSLIALPLLLVWIAGSLMMLVRVGRDLVAVERLVARAHPVDLPPSLKERLKGVRVAVSSEAPGPMAAGLFRPVVVLPESATNSLNSVGTAALLEHERAHIERRDMAVALIQRVVLALLWWSPALHWISRRLDEERELACDETAVERTGDARAFARSLTTQAENQLWARAPRLAVGAIGPRSQFGRRIKRLIEIAKSGGAAMPKYSGRLAFSGLALTVIAAALVTPRILAEPKSPPPVDASIPGETQSISKLINVKNLANIVGDARKRDVAFDDRTLAGGHGDDDDFSSMMDAVNDEVQDALRGLPPGLDVELAGLSEELTALGSELALSIDQEVAAQLPAIMQEVRLALQEADRNGWSDDFDRQEFEQEMRQMREELKQAFGPQFREELRQSLQEARQELAEQRQDRAKERSAAMEETRRAMEDARRDIERARARGDFKLTDEQREEMRKAALEGKAWKDKFGNKGWAEFGRMQAEIGRQAAEQARQEIARARDRGDFDFHFDFDDLDGKRVTSRTDIKVKGDVSDARRLLTAASRGDEDRVRELIKAGADVNAVFPGDGTALIAAAREGETEVVRLLLDKGAQVNLASPHDGNALIAAASEGEKDVVELLLARGANVNAYVEGDETALIAAAKEGELEIVKLLVARGADVNRAYMVDGRLRSPLNVAQRNGNDEVADFLKSRGAKADPKPAN